MDTGALIYLAIVFLVAFGIGGITARRFVPAVEGEHWTQRGKRNAISLVVGWAVLGIAVAAVFLLAD